MQTTATTEIIPTQAELDALPWRVLRSPLEPCVDCGVHVTPESHHLVQKTVESNYKPHAVTYFACRPTMFSHRIHNSVSRTWNATVAIAHICKLLAKCGNQTTPTTVADVVKCTADDGIEVTLYRDYVEIKHATSSPGLDDVYGSRNKYLLSLLKWIVAISEDNCHALPGAHDAACNPPPVPRSHHYDKTGGWRLVCALIAIARGELKPDAPGTTVSFCGDMISWDLTRRNRVCINGNDYDDYGAFMAVWNVRKYGDGLLAEYADNAATADTAADATHEHRWVSTTAEITPVANAAATL